MGSKNSEKNTKKLSFVETPKYKKFIGYLYGWGASLVIIGALFKINHYPGSNLMLILGMGTEAIIFFLSAFDKQHPDYDWDRVYPALKNNPDGTPMYAEGEAPGPSFSSGGLNSSSQNLLAEKLEEMLEKANVTPAVFERLSSGLEKLSQTTNNLNNLTSVVGVNQNYSMELAKMTEHIATLNKFYTDQIQTTKTQAEASVKLQADVNKIMETLSASLESSKKYREEIDELSSKVAALNRMYGQMIQAMQGAQNPKM